MHIYLLVIILLQYIIVIQTQETTPTMTVSSSSTTFHTTNSSSTTLLASNNGTHTTNATVTSMSFSPSPTSFVFTHFPVFPTHARSMSSSMSSAKPSQSAPYPDDTIGKNGRLHISGASTVNAYSILLICPFIIYTLA